jgi:hypothetical protein
VEVKNQMKKSKNKNYFALAIQEQSKKDTLKELKLTEISQLEKDSPEYKALYDELIEINKPPFFKNKRPLVALNIHRKGVRTSHLEYQNEEDKYPSFIIETSFKFRGRKVKIIQRFNNSAEHGCTYSVHGFFDNNKNTDRCLQLMRLMSKDSK